MARIQEGSTTAWIRWSGASLMLAGFLLAVHYFTHPAGETAQFAFEPLWVPSHLIGAVAFLLIPLGLLGLFARQYRQMGRLGFFAAVLTYVGCALSGAALIFISAVLVPFLAARGLDWGDSPSGALYAVPAFQIALGAGAGVGVIGLLIVAVVTLRAHVVPSLGAWLIILSIPLSVVGALLVFVIGTAQQGLIQAFVGSVVGLGLAAWGWALWSEEGSAVTAAPAVPLVRQG